MQINPRYDGPPAVRFEGEVPDPVQPMLQQRRRLSEVLGGLDAVQWSAASRCEGWSVQDVVSHLVSVNTFWSASISAGRAGTPTRFLATFDPVATPAQLVEGTRALAPDVVLERYVASVEALADAVAGMDEPMRSTVVAEAPPGHVPMDAVLLHALWDAWVHERDVLLPLGDQPVENPEEVAACLLYAAALGPAFLALSGSARTGQLAVEATDPSIAVTIDLGPTVVARFGSAGGPTATLSGRGVDLVEAFSFRGPFPVELGADDQWLLGGLGEVFDRSG